MIRLNECRGRSASRTLLIAALSFAVVGCEAAAKDATPKAGRYVQTASAGHSPKPTFPRYAQRASSEYDWHANGNRKGAKVILAGAGRDDFNVPKFINGRGGYVCSVSGGGRRTKCYSK